MTYLFPYAGMENPPKPPKRPKPQQPTHHPRRFVAPPVVELQRVSCTLSTMTAAMRIIAEQVCEKHRVLPHEIASKAKTMRIIRARREYIYRCRVELEKSFPQIGKSLGQDHTTAVHAFYTAEKDPSSMEPFCRKKSQKKTAVIKEKPDNTLLNERQTIVYCFMKQGLTNIQIAEILGLTNKKIQNDRYEINNKMKRRIDRGDEGEVIPNPK